MQFSNILFETFKYIKFIIKMLKTLVACNTLQIASMNVQPGCHIMLHGNPFLKSMLLFYLLQLL